MRSLPVSALILLLASLLLASLMHAQTGGDTGPSILIRHEPAYSAEAARARVQSTVLLNITVGEDGKAHDVRVAEGAGFGLDEKAVETIATWVFKPATKDGKPVASPANVEMNFHMLVKDDPEDHTGQFARLNFTLPPDATRPVLIVGKLPGNPAAPGDQALRFRMQVDAQGVPKDIAALGSTDPVWEKQVRQVLEKWRFRPATEHGIAIAANGVFELAHTGAPAPAVTVQESNDDEATETHRVSAPLPVSGLSPRADHTATLLANGTVLLAGGETPGPSPHEIASAQTFDWATRTIVNTGSLLTARKDHTATLLKDGGVLIAGGRSGARVLASAEIFDPSTGRFSATGSLHEARQSPSGALLPDGRVLICGGAGADGKPLTSAEIYDPRTKSFLPAGSMTAPRAHFHAVTLKDGRILLVGGAGASAEIFDPESGAFSAVGDITTARSEFSATLLDNGQVLIAGGGSGANGGALNSAGIFEPISRSFHATGSMTGARERQTAARLKNGKVVIVGGSDSANGGALAPTEIYDPAAGTFSLGPLLAGRHIGHTATLLEDGSVLVAGSSVAGSGNSAELLIVR